MRRFSKGSKRAIFVAIVVYVAVIALLVYKIFFK